MRGKGWGEEETGFTGNYNDGQMDEKEERKRGSETDDDGRGGVSVR